MLSALGKLQAGCADTQDRFITDSFDWFFYYVDRIEHYIQTGLIEFTDVASVFRPYARKIKDHQEIYGSFMAACEYELAATFWKRYEASR